MKIDNAGRVFDIPVMTIRWMGLALALSIPWYFVSDAHANKMRSSADAVVNTENFTLIALPIKDEFEFGEDVIVRLQLVNRTERTFSILPPCHYTVWNTLNNVTHCGAGPNRVEAGPQSKFHFNDNISQLDMGRVISSGNHFYQACYEGRIWSDTVVLRVKAPDALQTEKIAMWKAAREAEGDSGESFYHLLIDRFAFDSDPLTRRIRMDHLWTRHEHGNGDDLNFHLREIDRMIEIYGEHADIYRFKGMFLKRAGRLGEAAGAMVKADAQLAVDWMEELVFEPNHPTPDMADVVIQTAPFMKDAISDRGLAERLASIEATAYHVKGDLKKAIDLMRPIIPEEAERWEREAGLR